MIGSQLGHFRILEQLGVGGMSEVYVAEDTKLGRKVALKVLPPELARDADRLSRFDREAKTLAALSHPNIVTIYSVEQADGVHFLTMALVEGKTLAELVTSGEVSAQRFLAIAIAITNALSAAHARGIVHRDLKPSNVIVDSEDWVRVLDFGLAKVSPWAEGLEDAPTLAKTRDGLILGTIPYMSPEQVQGKGVDARSDIFSLGIILFEMATGTHPFPGDSAAHVMSSILRDREPPVGTLRRDFPRAWERIIAKCLEKDPARRYQSAEELRQELEGLAAARAPRIRLPRAFPRWPREGRRLRTLLAALGTLTLLLVGGWLLLTRPRTSRPSAQSERTMLVVLPFENIGPAENEYFVAGLSEEITSRLSVVSSLGIISRKSALQYTGTTKSTKQISDELGVDYILDGTVRWSRSDQGVQRVRITPQLIRAVDDTGLWAETFDRVVEDIFQVQSDIAEEVFAQLGVTLIEPERQTLQAKPTDNLEAYQAYLRGRYLERVPDYSAQHRRAVIELYEKSVELDPEFAPGYMELSLAHSFYYHLGYDLSEQRRLLARRAADRAFALAPESPQVHFALGFYQYWVEGDYELALQEFELAEAGLPSNAEVLEGKALVYRRQGRWQTALDHFQRALRLSPRDASLQGELAETLANTRRFREAIHHFDLAIALAPGESWLYSAKTFTYWIWKGATEEAGRTLEQMPATDDSQSVWVRFWQEIFAGDPEAALQRLAEFPGQWIEFTEAYTPTALLAAHAYRFAERPDEARSAYQEARSVLEAEVEQWPGDPRRHSALGIAYAALGQREEAIREGSRAVELHPLSEDAFSGAYYVSELAFIYTLLGEHDQALDLIEELLAKPSLLTAPMLRLDPRWQPLSNLPRFQRLLRDYAEPTPI